MKRVMVVGQPGAGKSTLARTIGAETGLPVVHMDMLHWMSGWQERDRAERAVLIAEAEAGESWVIDGNYTKSLANRVARADTFVWIDLGVWLRFRRVFWRITQSYGRTRPDLPEGCPERFNAEFLWYIWQTRKTGRAKSLDVLADAPEHLTIHHLRSPREVDMFLTKLRDRGSA